MGTQPIRGMINEANKEVKLLPPPSQRCTCKITKMKQFLQGGPPIVPPFHYRVLKLTVLGVIGVLSLNVTIWNKMGTGSVEQTVGVITRTMFNAEDNTNRPDNVSGWLVSMFRACVLCVNIKDKFLRFIWLYAPSDLAERPDLYRKVEVFLTRSRRVVLAGDWNAVLNTDIDRRGARPVITTEMWNHFGNLLAILMISTVINTLEK